MPRVPGHRRRARRPATRSLIAAAWLAPTAAALLACLVYVKGIDNPFVYDDRDTVVSNPSLVDLSNVRFILEYSPFRPALNVSYAVDRWLWDFRPRGYHLTNMALHALTVILLYLLLVAAIEDSRRPTKDAEDSDVVIRWAAFTGASIFAVHPLMTEAVGYVSGRSEVLCAVWFIAALLLARRWMITTSWLSGAAAAICGLLALASKEVAIGLPVVVIAYDWLLRPGSDDARRRRALRVFLPLFAIVAISAAYRVIVLYGAGTGLGLESPALNALTQSIVIWRYLGLLVWPASQSIMHGVHHVSSVADPLAWFAVAGLVAVCAGAFRMRTTAPLVPFGLLWFFAAIAPSSSFVALREGMAEHRVYLASAGLFTIVAAASAAIYGRERRADGSIGAGLVSALVAVLVVLGYLTMKRTEVWSSPISLWTEATVRAEGMWEPHYALADAQREAGNCDAAVPEYRQVVALRPGHRDAHTNLGICLGQSGHLQDAEASFMRVLEIDPSFARGYTNLAALALVAGDPGRARDFYREAIVKDPNNVLARMQLAGLYERTFHDYHSAARMCGEARQLAPATPGVVECVDRNQRLAAGR